MSKDLSKFLLDSSKSKKYSKEFKDALCDLSSKVYSSEVLDAVESNVFGMRNLVNLVNVIFYSNVKQEAKANKKFTPSELAAIALNGVPETSEQFIQIEETLGDRYLDYHDFHLDSADSDIDISSIMKKPAKAPKTTTKSKTPVKSSTKSTTRKKALISEKFQESDEDFWIQSVRLDLPLMPQPNVSDIVEKFSTDTREYCLYGESELPWAQSQITCFTEVSKFSEAAILNLFPPIRLYTRSPYMYQQYDNLDYDEDLGVIIPISGYTEDELKTNLIEYPHLDHLERCVKVKGKETTIPFWKYIEIDGEMVPTASVWEDLKDTTNLPKTESFMNEYVVRKYILDTTLKGAEYKHEMRGTLGRFLTLYAPPEYYKAKGYDPLNIGRDCILSRKSFKYSRNPILAMKKAID